MLKTIIHATKDSEKVDDKKLQIQECHSSKVKAMDASVRRQSKKIYAAFKVLETQFQMFIKSQIYLDNEYVDMNMSTNFDNTLDLRNSRIPYTLKPSSTWKSVKKSNDEWRVTSIIEDLVDTESMGQTLKKQRYKQQIREMMHIADDADISPIQLMKSSMLRQRFASQVDVNDDLSKPVTTHYLPKERESAIAKPHHMIAPGSSRYSSNDMVHNHYLEEAKKKTQESSRNSEPSVMPSARSQSTANGSKPKPRINNQKSRNWPASKSSCVTTKTVPIAEHSRNSRSFSDYKHFVCSTCQKCVFNANHDSCVTKFLNEVNSRAKVPSHKTTTRYKPVEQTSVAKKPERQIPKRHKSSIKKTSVVHEKTMTPRSCLRWKPTGKIFKTVGLKWIPTGKILTSSTTKVDSEPTNGSNDDITNQYECKQTLDVSAGTLNIHAGTSLNPTKEGLRVWLLKRLISEKPGLQGIFI
ncbi:hypothetical protein Tco_0436111 [Tanacetum coccineum]